jgi:hypothetical protein
MKKIILPLLNLIATQIFAQTITNLSPTSGAIGSSVSITGTNFDPTPANNTVWFGGVKAIISAATATKLTVTVPIGAMHEPIRVLVAGKMAQSPIAFIVTFNGGLISTSSLATKVDFATGNAPNSIAIGDLDGDGKLDLAIVNINSSTVSVYRNTSTSGTLSSGSFATNIDFATGDYPYSVAIGDLDGDGKLDLAIANNGSNTISVFRNTSTSGTITSGSFATKVDFTTGTTPYFVAIGDIDGDGKLDLAVANANSNTVSVLRNTATSGTIASGSFETEVNFETGTGPLNVSIADIDGDGKLDLVVMNYNVSTVSVLRNTTTSGKLSSGSFATKVDFAPGFYPSGLTIGDIDGDGKLDLALTNSGSNTISVFRNTATSGTIASGSFATKVDFATGFNPTSIAIGDIDGDGKLDLVVGILNNVSVYKNTASSGTIASGSLATNIDFATGKNPYSVAIADIDGDGKLDLAVANYNLSTVSLFKVMCNSEITLQPTNQNVIVGNNAQFVTTSAESSVSFQWQSNTGSGFQNLTNTGQNSGVNNDTLNISNATTSNNNETFRCIVVSGACSDTSTIATLKVNPISNLQGLSTVNALKVYPNPATTILYIELEKSGNFVAKLSSITGQSILSSTTGSIDISALANGVYFINIYDSTDQLISTNKVTILK